MEENKKISKKKLGVIVATVIIFVIAIGFKLFYDRKNLINTLFFCIDVVIFLGFTGTRIYKDWKIKEEMYFFNKELKEVSSSSYIAQEDYEKLNNNFLEGKYSTLKEEWDSFSESIFFENGIAFQTVDAELFFNDSTLLRERMNKRLLDYIPQLLLAIGIFGTFLGLVLGLSGLDLSAGDNSQLNNLINGTKVSFLTSLYGMYFSIAVSFLMNIHIGDYEENILKIKNNLNRIFKQALPEQSLLKIEKELGAIKSINNSMSSAIGKELISVIQSYNETNEEYMKAVTEIVKTNISGLAENVSSLFEEKMKKIFSEEFISKFEELNRNTLEIATNNNKNIEEYKNEIAKISNSISITNDTLTSFCNGALKNYDNVAEKYDERFNNMLNLIDNSKQNYQEFLALLKESANVLKVSNKYISKTDDTFKLINKFLEQENSLVNFWEQNKEIVSSLNKNLEEFFDKYHNKLNIISENLYDNFDKIYEKMENTYEEFSNKVDNFTRSYENSLSNLNEEYNENLIKSNEKTIMLFENYDRNLSSIVTNFVTMVENLKLSLENINYDRKQLEDNNELNKKLLELIEEIEETKKSKEEEIEA